MKRILVVAILSVCVLLSACGGSANGTMYISENPQSQSSVMEASEPEPEPEPIVTYSKVEIADKYEGNKLSIEGLYLEYIGIVDDIDTTSEGYYVELLDPDTSDGNTYRPILVYCNFYGDNGRETVLGLTRGDIVRVIGKVTRVSTIPFIGDLDDIYIDCELCEIQ